MSLSLALACRDVPCLSLQEAAAFPSLSLCDSVSLAAAYFFAARILFHSLSPVSLSLSLSIEHMTATLSVSPSSLPSSQMRT